MQKIVIVIGLILLTAFSSCEKDDSDNATSSDLVGTWAEKPSIEQFTFIFDSNGQGIFQIKNCTTNKVLETESFAYVFNTKTNEIKFSGFDEVSIAYVKFLSKTSIRLYNDAAFTGGWDEEMYKQ
jgi:hypothetical protein